MEKKEFTYSESIRTARNRYHQIIKLDDREVGILSTRETSIFAPMQKIYLIPDVEKGLYDRGENENGTLGWIDFKRFDNYDEAFKYVTDSFEEVAYLFEVGEFWLME